MMNSATQRLFAVAIAMALAGACSKEDKKEAGSNKGDEAAKAAANDKVPAAEPDQAPTMTALFANYEAIRATLAKDATTGVAALAQQISSVAESLAAEADEAHKSKLEAVAAEAGKLAGAGEGDITATRMAFGELSRSLVSLVESDSDLAEGMHVFECPMAKGYQRWLQPGAELENPYMGQEMLACGSEVTGEY